MNIYKTILSHTPKYLTGSIISAGATLFMTKYYTTVFSPSQFGILALYLVMFEYIRTFVSLNMDSGATRFYFDYKDTRRDEYLSTIFWFITFIAFIVIIIGVLFKDFISKQIAPDTQDIYLATIFLGIGAVYVSFLTRILYNEHKSNSVLKHTIFQTFINHFSSFIFISFFNLGILGRINGQGLGYFLNIFTLLKEFFTNNLFRLRFIFTKSMASETFILALPGIIAAFQNVVFIYMDRIFIKYYIGDSAVGVYTLGFMLGQGLSMVYEAISQAILPKVYNDMKENYAKARDELEHFAYRYYIGLVIITITISLLSPLIVSIFSNENYSEASNIMPFVMAGFMMGGFYKIPSLILGFHKKVWFYPFLSAFAFGINALLNWYLIPLYGIIGAGFASFIGLFLYSLLMQILSFKYMSRKYNILTGIWYILIFMSIIFFINLTQGI
jgi:O-antigen/teichoic acid export membrane protein